jgi:hypothetical protein
MIYSSPLDELSGFLFVSFEVPSTLLVVRNDSEEKNRLKTRNMIGMAANDFVLEVNLDTKVRRAQPSKKDKVPRFNPTRLIINATYFEFFCV